MDPKLLQDVKTVMRMRFQHALDKTVPHTLYRWLGFLAALLIYWLRVYTKGSHFIVTYGLGIYILNLFVGFITPPIDPETEGPLLPRAGTEEFRPFSGRVPEFKFWRASTQAVLTAFVMTFFPFFDIPVFWPILLTYWLLLFFLTMRNQISHMIRYRYLPFSWGKAKYGGKGGAGKDGGKGKKGDAATIGGPSAAMFSGTSDNSVGRGGGVNVERLTSISEPRFNPAQVR